MVLMLKMILLVAIKSYGRQVNSWKTDVVTRYLYEIPFALLIDYSLHLPHATPPSPLLPRLTLDPPTSSQYLCCPWKTCRVCVHPRRKPWPPNIMAVPGNTNCRGWGANILHCHGYGGQWWSVHVYGFQCDWNYFGRGYTDCAVWVSLLSLTFDFRLVNTVE